MFELSYIGFFENKKEEKKKKKKEEVRKDNRFSSLQSSFNMPKFTNLLTLFFLSCVLILPGTLAIFPNREFRNDILIELRQESIAYQFALCNLCYETVNDLTSAPSSNYLTENMGISGEEGDSIAGGMRTLLVSRLLGAEEEKISGDLILIIFCAHKIDQGRSIQIWNDADKRGASPCKKSLFPCLSYPFFSLSFSLQRVPFFVIFLSYCFSNFQLHLLHLVAQ